MLVSTEKEWWLTVYLYLHCEQTTQQNGTRKSHTRNGCKRKWSPYTTNMRVAYAPHTELTKFNTNFTFRIRLLPFCISRCIWNLEIYFRLYNSKYV